MAYRDLYPDLIEALNALHNGRPVGSQEVMLWLLENKPDTVNNLRQQGYLDPNDPLRLAKVAGTLKDKRVKVWSWRSYIANAMVRLAQQGSIQQAGHTDFTPEGYSAPVGLWLPSVTEKQVTSFRLPREVLEKIRSRSSALGMTAQELVTQLLTPYPPDLVLPTDPDELLNWLEEDLPSAIEDAGVSLPVAQRDLMWVTTALSLRLSERFDPGEAPWSVCMLQANWHRLCGPPSALARISESDRGEYEEGTDLTLFSRRGQRWWPVLSVESEGANWSNVDGLSDYTWDFYKLFGRQTAACLFVCRVAGTQEESVLARMRTLSETLEQRIYKSYGHLSYPGQPFLIAILPGAKETLARLGAGVATQPIRWRELNIPSLG